MPDYPTRRSFVPKLITATFCTAAMVAALTGCANVRSSETGTTTSDAPQAETQTETTPPDSTPPEAPTPDPSFSYATDTYTASYTDTNGYKQTITVTIGTVIPGSAADKLSAAWSQIGGAGG
jgi:hypothetical protein